MQRAFLPQVFLGGLVAVSLVVLAVRGGEHFDAGSIYGVAAAFAVGLLVVAFGLAVLVRRLDREIQERAQAQEEQRKLNRSLRLLSECNAALVHARDEGAILDGVCRLVVQTGGYRMAWVGIAQGDPECTVRILYQYGCGEGYLAQADISWGDHDERGRGPAGAAIRTGTTQVVQDFLSDSVSRPWHEAARLYGYRSCIALPLVDGVKVYGVLAIYGAECDCFGKEEVKLLEELNAELTFGLNALRATQTRIEERKLYENQMEYRATHDLLTGLANRGLLNDRLEQAMASARRSGRPLGVMLLDLDRFKWINDSLGHAAGDGVLRETAKRLSACVRGCDTVARLGGDEFMVLMPDLRAPEDAAPVARKLLESMAQSVRTGMYELVVTTSIGIAIFPRDGTSVDELLRNVDVAMYRAKETGRNAFQFYAPEMNERALDRVEIENGLRHAIENEELELLYQPKIELAHGRVIGAEALIRWKNPDRGLMSPGDFIPLAEETGLIVPIGQWAIETVCAQVGSWLDRGFPGIPVAVNVSARQMHKGNLPEIVSRALKSNGLAAQYLDLELTESVAMANPEHCIEVMRRLKAIGVGISLDDFGTGYSSLNYLKRFPIDSLKVDQSFVRDITSDPDDAAIATAVITLAHSMKRKVIAEGVETEAQLRFLRRHHCDEMQGYLFSGAVSAAALLAMVREGRRLPVPSAEEDFPQEVPVK